MSKMVVGRNMQPGDQAAEDRLRVAEHEPTIALAALQPVAPRACVRLTLRALRVGNGSTREARAISRPMIPMSSQNWFQADRRLMAGPTRELASRATAMPNIWVRPDQGRRARRREMGGGDVGAPIRANDAAQPWRNRPKLAIVGSPVAKAARRRPSAAAQRHDLARTRADPWRRRPRG